MSRNLPQNFWSNQNFTVEPHPYGDFIPELPQTLVIGTFPSHKKNARFKFYYGGEDNWFWPLLSVVFDRQFKKEAGDAAANERRGLLDTNKIAVTDMILCCYRYRDWSGDDYIFPIKFRDVCSLLDEYSTITRLIFTSRLPIIGAWGLFETHLRARDIEPPELNRDPTGFLFGVWRYSGRDISIWVPRSPSNRAREKGNIGFDDFLAMYKKAFKA